MAGHLESKHLFQFEWTLPEFESLPERVYSETFGPPSSPWRLLLFPGGNATHLVAGQHPSHLSLYLDAPKAHTAVGGRPSQSASFNLTVVHPTNPALSVTKAATHTFSSLEWDWGYTHLLQLSTLKAHGYLGPGPRGGTLRLHVEGTGMADAADACGLGVKVDVAANSGAACLARMFGTGLWCDCVVHADPMEPGTLCERSAPGPSGCSSGVGVAHERVGSGGAGAGSSRRTRPVKPWECDEEMRPGSGQVVGSGTSRVKGKRAKVAIRVEVETYVEGPSSSGGGAGGAVGAGGGAAGTGVGRRDLLGVPPTPERVPLLLGRDSSSACAGVGGVVGRQHGPALLPTDNTTTTTCAITGAVLHGSRSMSASCAPHPVLEDGPHTPDRSNGKSRHTHRSAARCAASTSTVTGTCTTQDLHHLPPASCGISCHRVVLAAASDPLRAMLAGDMVEGARRVVIMRGVAPEVLGGLVRWCYGLPVSLEAVRLVELWSLAHQYDVQGLCNAVVTATSALLDTQPHLALDMYAAVRCSTPNTSPICTAVGHALERHLALTAASPGFVSLPWHHVAHVLRCAWDRYMSQAPEPVWQVPHDMLGVCDAVLRWLLTHHVVAVAITPVADTQVAGPDSDVHGAQNQEFAAGEGGDGAGGVVEAADGEAVVAPPAPTGGTAAADAGGQDGPGAAAAGEPFVPLPLPHRRRRISDHGSVGEGGVLALPMLPQGLAAGRLPPRAHASPDVGQLPPLGAAPPQSHPSTRLQALLPMPAGITAYAAVGANAAAVAAAAAAAAAMTPPLGAPPGVLQPDSTPAAGRSQPSQSSTVAGAEQPSIAERQAPTILIPTALPTSARQRNRAADCLAQVAGILDVAVLPPRLNAYIKSHSLVQLASACRGLVQEVEGSVCAAEGSGVGARLGGAGELAASADTHTTGSAELEHVETAGDHVGAGAGDGGGGAEAAGRAAERGDAGTDGTARGDGGEACWEDAPALAWAAGALVLPSPGASGADAAVVVPPVLAAARCVPLVVPELVAAYLSGEPPPCAQARTRKPATGCGSMHNSGRVHASSSCDSRGSDDDSSGVCNGSSSSSDSHMESDTEEEEAEVKGCGGLHLTHTGAAACTPQPTGSPAPPTTPTSAAVVPTAAGTAATAGSDGSDVVEAGAGMARAASCLLQQPQPLVATLPPSPPAPVITGQLDAFSAPHGPPHAGTMQAADTTAAAAAHPNAGLTAAGTAQYTAAATAAAAVTPAHIALSGLDAPAPRTAAAAAPLLSSLHVLPGAVVALQCAARVGRGERGALSHLQAGAVQPEAPAPAATLLIPSRPPPAPPLSHAATTVQGVAHGSLQHYAPVGHAPPPGAGLGRVSLARTSMAVGGMHTASAAHARRPSSLAGAVGGYYRPLEHGAVSRR